ncbi:MAG: hypothetical protein QW046_04320 [Candidatus Micrarchaeaceae archaeon]
MVQPREVSRKEVENILKEQKLRPALIKNSTIIRFVKKPSDKYDFITVDQLYQVLEKQNLGIRASGSYLMIYSKDKAKQEKK